MPVELVAKPTSEISSAINTLLPQLSASASPLNDEQISALISQENVFLFVFRGEDSNEITGMLTLATFVIPTGIRAWIEDVVVSEAARGQGAGKALVNEAVAYAATIGAKSVDLTSRPAREAANRLYMRCGFEMRDTNVYRYKASNVLDSL